MLASFTAGMEYPRGDVDQNGVVDITDVVTLIDYLLNETWPDEPSPASDMTFTVNGVSFTMVAVEGGDFLDGRDRRSGHGYQRLGETCPPSDIVRLLHRPD